MEQVHAHLAKATVVPHQPDPQIPAYCRPSILKLMAKNAGDRYQSSSGNPCSLYIFFDRVYEIAKASGNIWRFDEYADFSNRRGRTNQRPPVERGPGPIQEPSPIPQVGWWLLIFISILNLPTLMFTGYIPMKALSNM